MLNILTSILLVVILVLIATSGKMLSMQFDKLSEFEKVAKFKPGMIIEHKLTGEKMLVLSFSFPYKGNYIVRTKNNEKIAIYEIEIKDN